MDLINALFELGGALLTWMNVRQIWLDKGHRGLYVPAIVVFALWGAWNLYYYYHLKQMFSWYATWVMVAANFSWVALLLHFGRKQD